MPPIRALVEAKSNIAGLDRNANGLECDWTLLNSIAAAICQPKTPVSDRNMALPLSSHTMVYVYTGVNCDMPKSNEFPIDQWYRIIVHLIPHITRT